MLVSQAADTGSRRTDEGAQVELSTSTASTADTSASGSTARKEHESAAAGSRWRSETEVYAAEALAAARAAEAAWNERIRNAYASVAASTPFQSSSAQALSQDNKPKSHALSYARLVLQPPHAPENAEMRYEAILFKASVQPATSREHFKRIHLTLGRFLLIFVWGWLHCSFDGTSHGGTG